MPEARKRYPFRAEPSRIGHYMEYPPPGGGGGVAQCLCTLKFIFFSSFSIGNTFLCYFSQVLIAMWLLQNPKRILRYFTAVVKMFKRRIKEAIQIKLTKPALNRDNGYELAAIYDTILTPKRR